MNNKQILDDAPKGATHWDKLQYYRIRFNDSSLHVAWDVFNQGSGKWNSVGDMYLTDVYKARSLSDIREIEQLKTQLATAKSEWISAEDRLPSDSERLKESIVLVANQAGDVFVAFLRRPRLYDKYSVFLDEWRGFAIENVTHWMPLPEAPKEQGE